MGLVLLGYVIFVINTVTWLMPVESDRDWQDRTGAFARRSASLVLAFLPAAVLVLDFLRRYGVSVPDASAGGGMIWLATQLAAISVLFLFDRTEAIWIGFLLGGIAYLAALSLPMTVKRPASLGLLLAIAGFVVIYFFAPLTTRDLRVFDRVLPAFYFTVILWLGSCYRRDRSRCYLAVTVVAALVTVAGGVSRAWHHARIDAYVRDYLSLAAEIAPESTILNANRWRQDELIAGEPLSWRVDPFRHAAAMLTLGKQGIFLGASLLSRNKYGYFPVYYRAETDWIGFQGRAELKPARPGFTDYNNDTPGQIDYVTLWPVVDGDLEPFAGLLRKMGQEYELVATSAPLGLGRLYRRRADERPDARVE